MNAITGAKDWVTSKTKQGASTASKESNKSVAKDSNVGMMTRARAAGNAMGDKLDEQQHKRESNLNKQKAKHNY